MKFSISPYCLGDYLKNGSMNIKEYIEYCGQRKQGFDAVDLGYFWKDEDEEVKQTPKWLKENGLQMGSYIVGNEFTKPGKDERKAEVEKVKHAIDRAKQLDAQAMRIFYGYVREGFPSYEDSKKTVIDCFKECCEHAEKQKVLLAFENHGNICAKTDEMQDFVKSIGSKNLKYCVDIGNFMQVKEDHIKAIKKFMPDAIMTHIKDNKKGGEKPIAWVLGEGDINLKECLKIIKDSGFKGYNTIEYEGRTEPDQKVGLERSWKNTKQAAREIGG